MTTSFPFDVSIVLNTQAGSAFLIRALRSLEAAAYQACGHGLRVELLFVMNRSPSAHLALARSFVSAHFDEIRLIEVSRDSLGAARQDGLHEARGEYIMFADDDDLVSNNSIVEFHRLAQRMGRSAIVIPQYLIGFGAFHIIAEYRGSAAVSPLALIKYHPYISRIFLHSSAKHDLHYRDVPPEKGYGYEDWHFNATAIARGYVFASAPGTILFYRQRAAGLLNQYNVVSTRHIPPSTLFRPDVYLSVCRAGFADIEADAPRSADLEAVRSSFTDDPTFRGYVYDANQIDPSIDWQRIAKGSPWANWTGDLRCGAAYYRACGLVVGRTFDHVVLCDALSDAFVVTRLTLVLEALQAMWPNTSALVLAGRIDGGATVPEQLEARRAQVVDFDSLGADLSPEDRDAVTLRLIENTAPGACLHLFGGVDARRFFGSYRAVLGGMRVIYYRDIDDVSIDDGLPSIDGTDLDFVSEMLPSLSAVACDCRHAMERDRSRIGFLEEKWGYFHSAPSLAAEPDMSSCRPYDGSASLLWVADRSSPHGLALVDLVAASLSDAGIDAEIDVIDVRDGYGSCLRRLPGAALGQAELIPRRSDLTEYDALVHTAPTENLPMIVIEALAHGLPIVALESGGLEEVVINDRTGRLIHLDGSSDIVAELVKAIGACRPEASGYGRFGVEARAHMNQMRSGERVQQFLAAAAGRND